MTDDQIESKILQVLIRHKIKDADRELLIRDLKKTFKNIHREMRKLSH